MKEIKLSDIITFNPKETIKKGSFVIKIEMTDLVPHTKFIIFNKEKQKYTSGTKFRNNDVLLARITPCLENGKTAKVSGLRDEIAFGSTEFIVMRSKANLSDSDFIYYLAISKEFRKIAIKSMTGTSGRQRVQLDVLENARFKVPKYIDQVKIGNILSLIDKKIELNTHINNNLYEIGKAIYQEYFEKEKYTNGYEIKQLSEVTTNNRNKIDKNKEYKVLSAVNTGKLVLSDDYFDKRVYSKDIGKYLNVNKNDFAYNPARINIGSIGLNTYDFNCCVSPVYVTFSVDKDYIDFFDFYFKSKRFNAKVTLRASGSVRQALNYNDFGMIEILYPSKEMINKFNKLYSKIKNRINKNKMKINNLEQIRDALLPKIMNGEIDLDKIEI